jgi:hypothetical protein
MSETFDTTKLIAGDRVLLRWNGYRGFGQMLDGSWATVLRVKRTGTVVVSADKEYMRDTTERVVRPDHIIFVYRLDEQLFRNPRLYWNPSDGAWHVPVKNTSV